MIEHKPSRLSLAVLVIALAAAGLACNLGMQPPPTPAATAVAIKDGPAAGPSPTTPGGNSIPVQEEASSAVQAATYALAVFLGRDPSSFTLSSIQQTEFADTALGCPRPGEQATATATPGYIITLGDGAREYELHTSLDGLRVRCLSEDLRSEQVPSNTGIMATIQAMENQEYGTLASLLPATVALSTFPGPQEQLASSAFIAQLRDIWLGPGSLQADLNTNVLALMPSLELGANQIPVYSTGWGATRNTDGILIFDLAGASPILRSVLLVPEAQKAAAYRPASEEQEDEEKANRFKNDDFAIDVPTGWITGTLGGQLNLQLPDEDVSIAVAPWNAGSNPREGISFQAWIEASWPGVNPNWESIGAMEPLWASSGQPGYLVTWKQRRADGALETTAPIALFEANRPDFYALSVSLLTPERESEFRALIQTISIAQLPGLPADMNVYRHDELGYRIQYPAHWQLLPSPLGAAFQAPEQGVTISIGPWPMLNGPAPDQAFEDWVAQAPAATIQGYGQVKQIKPVETTAGDVGYVAAWQVTLSGGELKESDPAAIFPFSRQFETTTYHALAINLHVPTETVTFERMIATLVIESQNTAEMVFIPAGAFVRGSSDEQIAAWKNQCGGACRQDEFTDEAPQRLISLDAYYIDRTEVTVSQFKAFVEATSYRATSEQKGDPVEYTWRSFDSPDRQTHPVRWMSWDDANSYCQWAGKRLPTEAEWEKAARGDAGLVWPWGNTWNEELVPHGDTVAADSLGSSASPYGVLGMAGNVWEWVNDYYDPYYYGAAPDSNPPGPVQSPDRVLRGGSFNNAWWALRAPHRHHGGAQGYAFDHGFRCAADG